MTTVAKSPTTELSKFLGQMKSQIEMALPKHMNADRMCRLALTQFSSNPQLQKCDFRSIAACIMTSSQLGLEIGINGQAYMIPYGTTATFVPGWKGLIDLVNRHNKASVWTGAVFDGDEFDWALGDSPFVTHRPMGESDPGKMMFAYAVGKVHGSNCPIIECWPNERILKHRDKHNKVGKKHYSFENWEMYARKVVLLQVLKYMPQSVELSTAIEAAYEADGKDIKDTVVNGAVVSSLDNLTDRLIGQLDSTEDAGSETQEESQKTEKPKAKETPKADDKFLKLMEKIVEAKNEKEHNAVTDAVDAAWSSFAKPQQLTLAEALKQAAERIGIE